MYSINWDKAQMFTETTQSCGSLMLRCSAWSQGKEFDGPLSLLWVPLPLQWLTAKQPLNAIFTLLPSYFFVKAKLFFEFLFWKKKIIFVYFFREGKGDRKKGRRTSMCGCFLNAPRQELGPQPRHVPWLGIEPVTLWFAGWCSIHWATPAQDPSYHFYVL